MIIWVDAQLSPALAPWITENFQGIQALSLKWLGMRDSSDLAVFLAAREAGAVIISKDVDFLELLQTYGPPPKVIWLTCGNTSNSHLRNLLITSLPKALALLDGSDSIVEIR